MTYEIEYYGSFSAQYVPDILLTAVSVLGNNIIKINNFNSKYLFFFDFLEGTVLHCYTFEIGNIYDYILCNNDIVKTIQIYNEIINKSFIHLIEEIDLNALLFNNCYFEPDIIHINKFISKYTFINCNTELFEKTLNVIYYDFLYLPNIVQSIVYEYAYENSNIIIR